MAKRRRLTPAQGEYLAHERAPEVKSMFAPAPIAQVAGDAATTAALREVADELAAARAEGRWIQRLPLAAIEVDHLVRDRLTADDAEMTQLRDSLRARGQQVPIEVVDLGAGRYGLISGWRRLKALQDLANETQEARFETIQALLRRPETAADAYLAMVEENEIRVGLSYYERARIAARAAEQGVHPTAQAAIRALFASASRAKRSKIASFLVIHEALDGVLHHASAIPERLGLALSYALQKDSGLAGRLQIQLRKAAVRTETDELALLSKAVTRPKPGHAAPTETDAPARPGAPEEIRPGVWLQVSGDDLQPRYTLSGPGVDQAFRARLVEFLRA